MYYPFRPNKLFGHQSAKIIIIVLFASIYSLSFSQTFSEDDIKEFAKEINKEVQGISIDNAITIRGCYAYGRTIVYQYDVTKEWYPTQNMKKDIINNFKVDDISDLFFTNCYRNSKMVHNRQFKLIQI